MLPEIQEHPPEATIFWSSGPLKYTIDNSGYKLNLIVDQSISDYYRSLIPKYIDLNRQKYPAHISVIRKETPANIDLWGKYEGLELKFAYTNLIFRGTIYYWLNAFSKELEEIRLELGLPVSTQYTRPPGDFIKCFHITIGNTKGS